MTGFARVREQTALGELTVSLRTVNHRALDFHFHQGSEFYIFENATRALLKQKISRGHVEVRISLNRAQATDTLEYNRDVVGRYVAAVRKAAADFDVNSEPDLNAAFRLSGAFSTESAPSEIDEKFEPDLLSTVLLCAEQLNTFRDREGADLVRLLRVEADAILTQTGKMSALREQALPHFQARLLERLQSLLSEINLDPRRLAEEAAVLADRSDINEELARLKIHTEQLLEILTSGGEVGKKVDFLLQEMNRETNTILSKTSGIGDVGLTITDLGLATKANIERIREQALNIE